MDDLIQDTVEAVLLDILGEEPLKNILLYMQKNYSLGWKDIPDRPQDFAKALHDILGGGSCLIENMIIDEICLEVGLEPKWRKSHKFSSRINEIRLFCRSTAEYR